MINDSVAVSRGFIDSNGFENCPRDVMVTAVPLAVPTYEIFENTHQVQQMSRPAELSVAGQLKCQHGLILV